MQTNTYEGLHIIKKKQSITTDELVIEAPLQININTETVYGSNENSRE